MNTDKLLTRIDNLMSDDSAILKLYENKIDKVSKDKKRIEEEKRKIENDIKDIQTDIDDINKASELTDRFANLDDFEDGLKKLGESLTYIKKINKELERIPSRIEELENKISNCKENSSKASKSIEEAEDELSKLDVELSDAKRYQENLVDLVEIAKTGDINKTREEVLEILKHVGFDEKESLAAAKIILFPEEDLIPYFKKDNKEEIKEEKVEKEDIPVIEEEEEIIDNEPVITEEEEINLDPIISEEDTPDEIKEDKEEENEIDFNTLEIPTQEIKNDFDVTEILKNNGLAISKFNKEDLKKFTEDDVETINYNIDFLLEKNFKKEFIYKYPKVLSDRELNDKFDFIIDELQKDVEDIRLTPLILISYSLSDFKKLVEITTKTGIKAQDIPLTVYVKGLQSFLQNYCVLINEAISLDDNEISKFASVLTVNPIDFKMSLDAILSYGYSIKKSNGKYAIIALAKGSEQLMKEMDLIIEIGEEDILKFYPEVLSSDMIGLANRLKFIKKTGIPYKATAHGDVVYQSYVLNQEKLNKIVEKKLDLHELVDIKEANKNAARLIQGEEAMSLLDNASKDDLAQSMKLDNYKDFIKSFKHIEEKESSYVINDISFSKNKVIRNINYLLSSYDNSKEGLILLASLFHDARKTEEEMNKVISTLGIK